MSINFYKAFESHQNWVGRPPIPDQRSNQILITATNGQRVAFHFVERTQRVALTILNGDNKPTSILPENIPHVLKLIRNTQSFFRFFNHVSVRIMPFSFGENKLNIEGKLLGGDPYGTALESLKVHLTDLANPVLVHDLHAKL